MNYEHYRAWRRAAVLPAECLDIIDAAYEKTYSARIVTKGRIVSKPFKGRLYTQTLGDTTPATSGQRRGAPAADVTARPIPRCRLCAAPTLAVDDAWRPCCAVTHGARTRSAFPDGVTVDNFGLWQQLERAVDAAFTTERRGS